MIDCIENEDGSLTIIWDKNDPEESQLNTWTEQDFIDCIMDACRNTVGESDVQQNSERNEKE